MSMWDLEEGGGGLNGATGTITNAYFADGEYGWSLVLQTAFDSPADYPKFEDGQFTRYFGLGQGWLSADNGETATHLSGDGSKRYNKNSQVGQLIAQVAGIPGAQEALGADFNPYVAASWKGVHFEWANVPVQKRKPKVDEAGNRVQDAQGKDIWEDVQSATQLYPVAIVDSAPAASNGHVSLVDLALSDDDLATLRALAESAPNDQKFMEGVIGSYATNAKVMAAVGKDLAGLRVALCEPF